jgi:hypothetical protein
MQNRAAKITTRRGLLTLTVITVCTFVASGILGNGHHGLRGTFADIAWFAFLLFALTLVLAGITALARSRTGNRHESKPSSRS